MVVFAAALEQRGVAAGSAPAFTAFFVIVMGSAGSRLGGVLADAAGWRWSFAFPAPGPILGTVAMLRLRALPEAREIAGGRG